MPNKPKYHRPLARTAVANLQPYIGTDEFPTRLRIEADHSGYSVRHLRRLTTAAATNAASTDGQLDTMDAVTAVFLACGNVAAAHRRLVRDGLAVPPLRTFRRQITREMGTGQLAYARGGSTAFRDRQVYLKMKHPHRMHTIQLDHTELPIYVVPRGHKHAVKPWITAVMDAASRYILSWVVTFGRPTAEQVRAALIQALLLRPAPDGETLVGGRPIRAVWDRGLEFLATLITESSMRLGFIPVALPAYSPHLKGGLERFWGFLKSDLLPSLPGYCEGPADLRGNHAIASAALGEDDFLVKLADWMDHYLTVHVNSSTGMTALQVWQADPTPLDPIPAERLWQDFLLAKPAKVSKNGVRFDGIDYLAPQIMGTVGRTVEMRHLPHDRSFIEVFLDGEHLCTAYPSHLLSADDTDEIVARRKQERHTAMARFTVANTQRRTQHDTVGLFKDRDGRRLVVEPPAEDLLSGGNEAYARLITKSDNTDRLF